VRGFGEAVGEVRRGKGLKRLTTLLTASPFPIPTLVNLRQSIRIFMRQIPILISVLLFVLSITGKGSGEIPPLFELAADELASDLLPQRRVGRQLANIRSIAEIPA